MKPIDHKHENTVRCYRPDRQNFVFFNNIPTEITQAGAATQTAGAAAEAAAAATLLTAGSGAEAPARRHGTTLGEAPAADGGKTARQPASTRLSPSGTETAARTGKEI